jgi:hypothetical protein
LTVSRRAAAAALTASSLAGLLVGATIGRWAAPARVLERDHIVTSDRETSSAWHAYVGRTQVLTYSSTRWKTTTRWTPGGAIEQTAVALADTAREERAEASAAAAATREVVRYEERERVRIVEAKKPDWLIGAGAGYDLERRELAYGLQVGRRIAGPLFVELQAQKPWAAAAFLKIAF